MAHRSPCFSDIEQLTEQIGPGPKPVRRILVVCTGNICRSPMAQGYLCDVLARKGKSEIQVASAGMLQWAQQPASDPAIEVCQEHGIDIRQHRSSVLSQNMVMSQDIILVMETRHALAVSDLCPSRGARVYLLGEFSAEDPGQEIDDPIGMPIDFYRRSFETLRSCLDRFVAWLDQGKEPS